MNQKHLTQHERYQIQALDVCGQCKGQIAKQLSRHKSTIGRKFQRNASSQGYLAAQAEQLARTRALACRNARTIAAEHWRKVETYLRLWLSPQEVAGRLFLEEGITISHESIYQHVYRDKARGGDLVGYLRCQKQRRKRYASGHERRGQLKNRVCIEQRPALVQARQRVGDWEGDTVIGRGHQGVLVTLVERTSRYTLVRELPNREAPAVSAAIIETLRPHKQRCLTLTFDNGKEFADHVFFGNCLDADVYFAHPYHSWERGTNENTNGLIRQYFPKGMNFAYLSRQDVDDAAYRLNHRPRKCLDYLTPHEVFYQLKMTPLN